MPTSLSLARSLHLRFAGDACLAGLLAATAQAQSPCDAESIFRAPTLGVPASAIATADLNGDGVDDLVVRTDAANGYRVFLGGTATDAQSPIASEPALVPVPDQFIDLTGDGRVDLIGLVFEPTPGIAVLHGDGAGGFADTTFIPTFDVPNDVVAADFTNDGLADLVVTNTQLATFQFYRGLPGGGVADPVNTNFGSGVSGLAAHDFDEDGNLDLACIHTLRGTEFENTLSLLQGDGDGRFAEVRRIYVGGVPFGKLGLGDFDDNGVSDLFVAVRRSSGGQRPFLPVLVAGIGAFEFEPPLSLESIDVGVDLPFVLDADNDGRPDIAYRKIRVEGEGRINRGLAIRYGGPAFVSQDSLAFISTGLNDIVDGAIAFDSDADHRRDIILLPRNPDVRDVVVVRSFAERKFAWIIPVPFTDAQQVFARDVNGDGLLDVMISKGLREPRFAGVALATGPGAFAPSVQTHLPSGGGLGETGDFNGDGREDLLTAASRNGPPYLVLYSIGNRLDQPIDLEAPQNARFATGDLDGDGFDDVLLLLSNTPAIVYFGSKAGLLPPVEQNFLLTSSEVRVGPLIADLNRDGRGDLVAPFVDRIRVYLATAQRGLYEIIESEASFSIGRNGEGRPAFGDLNGDGHRDLAFVNTMCTGPVIVVAFGDGTGAFPRILKYENLPALSDVTLSFADLNADGRGDLLVGGTPILGDGVGGLSAAGLSQLRLGDRTDQADVDADGRPDMLFVSRNGVTVFLNQCRAPLCPADLTSDAAGPRDGLVTLADFARYLDLWSAGEPAADITATNVCLPGQTDGRVDLSDFACYLRFWASGCP
ncbi:MAG: VCBS repeat-containing protein [Planctomycetota bacterium]